MIIYDTLSPRQSYDLLKLNVPADKATGFYVEYNDFYADKIVEIPTFTLADMFKIIPKELDSFEGQFYCCARSKVYVAGYGFPNDDEIILNTHFHGKELIDALYSLARYLITNKYIFSEYNAE